MHFTKIWHTSFEHFFFFFQNRPGRYSVPTTPTPMDKQNYGVMRRAMPAHVVAAQGTIHILRKQIWRVFGPLSPYRKRAFTNYVEKFLSFLTPYVDIFYLINVDQKSTFLNYLPISSCQRSLWMPPTHILVLKVSKISKPSPIVSYVLY